MNSKQILLNSPSLFIKPSADFPVDHVLFTRQVQELGASLSFRSLDIRHDTDMIFNWVNKAYAQKFWQLKATRSVIENIYRAVLENPQAHSFIGLIGEKPICQVDVYTVGADELVEHVKVEPGDCGLHLLMCPPREMQKGWSYYALRCFQEFYFSSEQTGRLFAEPDSENYHANQLATNTGFRFLKSIDMSYKTANLYCLHREDFRPV